MAANSDVKAVQDWLTKQPHLPQTLGDYIVVQFLRSCDNSLERTKSAMELFFTTRADTPEVFRNRDPVSTTMKDTFNLIDLLPLGALTPDGNSCFILRFADPNPNKFNVSEILKLFFMVEDIQIRSVRKDSDLGLVSIFDMTGWSLRHIAKIPISPIKKYMHYCQEALPVRITQMHIINASSLLDKILALLRPFMKSEVASMIHTHPPGSQSLYNYVPKEILPKEYGGNGGSVSHIKENWRNKLEAERGWFLKDEWMTNESKRIGKKTTVQEGSFRSLSLD